VARVLIVEDDADLAQLVSRRLRDYGHNVAIAPSARLAMSVVGIDFPVDVVLLDVHLPGMDGFELLEELRRHPELDRPDLPAVFLSGSADPDNQERAQRLGCTFLNKPFVSGELQGALLQALGASGAS